MDEFIYHINITKLYNYVIKSNIKIKIYTLLFDNNSKN